MHVYSILYMYTHIIYSIICMYYYMCVCICKCVCVYISLSPNSDIGHGEKHCMTVFWRENLRTFVPGIVSVRN